MHSPGGEATSTARHHPTPPPQAPGPGLIGLALPASRALPTGAQRAWASEDGKEGEAGPAKAGVQSARARTLPPGSWYRATAKRRYSPAIVNTKARSFRWKKLIKARSDSGSPEDARRRSSPPSAARRWPGQAPATSPAPCSPPPGARAEAHGLGYGAGHTRPAGSRAQRPHVFAPRQGAGDPQEGLGPGRPCPRGHVLLAR